MNKVKKHLMPKRKVAERLRRMGFNVTLIPPSHGYDLLVNNRLRVALRVAYPRVRSHRVTSKGRRYEYKYRSWHFNFHRHGRIDRRYADVVVCLGVEPRQGEREKIFVIPWEVVSGKTFSLHAARCAYDGRYAPYRDNWEVIRASLDGSHDGTDGLRDVA
jgi:hypothetical protein